MVSKRKPEYDTFNDLQVRPVDKICMYCIAVGAMKELSIGEQVYAPKGELYLYQEYSEDEEYEKTQRDLYSKLVATGEKDLPSYEELSEYDGLIIMKAKYHLGAGEHSVNAILIDSVEPLQVEDQLTFDDDGNVVKASLFD